MRANSLHVEGMGRLGVTVHEDAGTARLRRSAHRRDRGRAAAASRQVHLVRWGHEPPATRSRLRVDRDSQRCVGAHRGSPSLLVIGGGATGVQLASIFNAFGSRVQLFQQGPRILAVEDEDVSAAVTAAFRASGMRCAKSFGTIESFETTAIGVRMIFVEDGSGECGGRDHRRRSRVGGRHGGADLAAADVETDRRGYVRVDSSYRPLRHTCSPRATSPVG